MHPTAFVVDAFTETPFGGNPAAVCLLESEHDERWLQAVAAEFNLSETAFLWPAGDDDLWRLRWFTPLAEVDLCGHATLAAAHVLWRERDERHVALRFHTRSGELSANREEDGIRLDFPADPPCTVTPPEGLSKALGARPAFVGRGRSDLLVVLDAADTLRGLTPDLKWLGALDFRGVIVTAQADTPHYDFISRFFAPQVGIPEDPVTGSAHCCLGLYWAERLGRSELAAYQASPRGGSLRVTVANDRVGLTGRAITVMRGELDV